MATTCVCSFSLPMSRMKPGCVMMERGKKTQLLCRRARFEGRTFRVCLNARTLAETQGAEKNNGDPVATQKIKTLPSLLHLALLLQKRCLQKYMAGQSILRNVIIYLRQHLKSFRTVRILVLASFGNGKRNRPMRTRSRQRNTKLASRI